MGFDQGSLDQALRSHLFENFGSASGVDPMVDAMSDPGRKMLTFVAGGRRVVQLEVQDDSHQPRWVEVTVTIDYGRTWQFTEPGWRPLSFGVGGDRPYWWSARHLVVLPTNDVDDPVVLDSDEDILLVFAVEAAWLIVCETSVRLFRDGAEVSRLELADVVVEARWHGTKLKVLDDGHRLVEIAVVNGELAAEVAV